MGRSVAASEAEYLLDSRSPVMGLMANRIPFSREVTADLVVRQNGGVAANGAALEIRLAGGESLFTTTLEGTVASVIRIRRPDSERTDIAVVAAGGAWGSMTDVKILGITDGETKPSMLLQSKNLLENSLSKRYPYFGVKGGILFVEYYVPQLNVQGGETGEYQRQRVYIRYLQGKYEAELPVLL